jgi:hypothetical protein
VDSYTASVCVVPALQLELDRRSGIRSLIALVCVLAGTLIYVELRRSPTLATHAGWLVAFLPRPMMTCAKMLLTDIRTMRSAVDIGLQHLLWRRGRARSASTSA